MTNMTEVATPTPTPTPCVDESKPRRRRTRSKPTASSETIPESNPHEKQSTAHKRRQVKSVAAPSPPSEVPIDSSNNNETGTATTAHCEETQSAVSVPRKKTGRRGDGVAGATQRVNEVIDSAASQGSRRGRNGKDANHSKLTVPSHSQPAQNSFLCSICSSDTVTHLAIGQCNHPICSLCALRLRSKSNDLSCTHCKSSLPLMVVYPIELSTRQNFDYSYFGLSWNADEELDTVRPDMHSDRALRLLYFQCADHFKYHDYIKSLHCPCSNGAAAAAQESGNHSKRVNKHKPCDCSRDCGQRFANNKQLLQHVSSAHDGQQLCSLCLTNRPLFVHEQQVFRNKAALKRHMNGKTAEMSDFTQFGEPFHKPHPLCEFCSEHVFDSLALYQHMTTKHLTCALCDASRMFRFYKNIASLRAHHRVDHFVCPVCDAQQQQQALGEDFSCAFQQFEEFRAHMREWHNERDCQRFLVSSTNAFHKHHFQNNGGQGAAEKNTRSNGAPASGVDREFFDLDLGAANPLPVAQFRAQQSLSQPSHLTTSTSQSQSLLELSRRIPSNMRIAGRVTGTGRFNMHDKDVLALQSTIDELRLQEEEELHRQRLTNSHAAGQLSRQLNAQAFPELAGSAQHATAVKETISAHPLSLVGKKSAKELEREAARAADLQREELERQEKEKELSVHAQQKRARQQKLADAFGISESLFAAQSLSQLLASCDTLASVDELLIREQLKGLNFVPSQSLLVPLFPADICQWARDNVRELSKWEKATAQFLTGSDPSLHCKPRPNKDRIAMHVLGRYWQCLSMEHDREPNRYVCLLRTAVSRPVSWSLSSLLGTLNISAAVKGLSRTNESLGLLPYVSSVNNAFHNAWKERSTSAVVYLVMTDRLSTTLGRVTDKQVLVNARTAHSPTSLGFSWRSVTPASLLLILQALCEQHLGVPLERICNRVSLAGPNAIAIDFDPLTLSLSLADLCALFAADESTRSSSVGTEEASENKSSDLPLTATQALSNLSEDMRNNLTELPVHYWCAPVQFAYEINRAIQYQQQQQSANQPALSEAGDGVGAFAEILKYFRVETDFDIPTHEFPLQSEDSTNEHVTTEEAEQGQDPVSEACRDAWDDDYVVLAAAGSYHSSAEVNRGEESPSQESVPDIHIAGDGCDDWEELDQAVTMLEPPTQSVSSTTEPESESSPKPVDEWEAFLAEKRAKSTASALYQPVIRNQEDWELAQLKRKEQEEELQRQREAAQAAQQQRDQEKSNRALEKKRKVAEQKALQAQRSANPFSFLDESDSSDEEDV